jgi:hypothetical protein
LLDAPALGGALVLGLVDRGRDHQRDEHADEREHARTGRDLAPRDRRHVDVARGRPQVQPRAEDLQA